MHFGITLGQEIFQKRMIQSFGDLEGVETDIDDMLVWDKTEEHLKRLLTLNVEKCKFGVP